jgi:hypothetical protein
MNVRTQNLVEVRRFASITRLPTLSEADGFFDLLLDLLRRTLVGDTSCSLRTVRCGGSMNPGAWATGLIAAMVFWSRLAKTCGLGRAEVSCCGCLSANDRLREPSDLIDRSRKHDDAPIRLRLGQDQFLSIDREIDDLRPSPKECARQSDCLLNGFGPIAQEVQTPHVGASTQQDPRPRQTTGPVPLARSAPPHPRILATWVRTRDWQGPRGQLQSHTRVAEVDPGPEEIADIEGAVEVARLLFDSGVDIVFLSSESGRLFLSEALPNRRVILVARTLDQVRRYATELFRKRAT